MKFQEIYNSGSPRISFELFPPRTDEGLTELEKRLPKLLALQPSLVTVTYGAGGSNRARTLQIASKIQNSYDVETAHHLTCVGSTKAQIDQILKDIQANNIENIVALRGDPPRGQLHFEAIAGGYDHGNELVEHISRHGGFGIAVAGYPEKHLEAPDIETDVLNLKRKVDSGADIIITQLYYDNKYYYEFRNRCESIGIHTPIIPGLMPILNLEQIQRITSMCGASMPKKLLGQLEECGGDQKQIQQVGVNHTANQALELLDQGVPGIHFYVLNQHFHIADIMSMIGPSIPGRFSN